MLEATAQSMYLMLFPESHIKWDPDDEGPGMRQLVNQIKKELRKKGAEDVDNFEKLYDSWKYMCKGSHPSGAGLLQVIARGGDERNIVGSVFRPDFVETIFDHGLWAMLMVLVTFPSLKVMDEEWNRRFTAWVEDRQTWRQNMLQQRGLEGDIGEGTVTSADLEF